MSLKLRNEQEEEDLQNAIIELRAKMLARARADDEINRPETEEDGIRAEALRRVRARRMSQVQQVQTPDSSQSLSGTPPTKGSPSDARASTPG